MSEMLRFDQLLERGVPFTRQHLARLEKDNLFPRRVALGKNYVVWIADEIDQWLAERIAARPGASRAIAERPVAAPAQAVDRALDQLRLSGRPLHALRRAGIATVGELARRQVAELLKLKGFGRSCLIEVERRLAAHGLHLGTALKPPADAQREHCEA